jgi:murein L,D-transpeptidase YcbB/YkuD
VTFSPSRRSSHAPVPRSFTGAVLLAAVLLLPLLTGCSNADAPPLAQVLNAEVQSAGGAQVQTIRRAYADRDAPIWLTPSGPTEAARDLLRQLCEAPQEGVPRERYRTTALVDTIRTAYLGANGESDPATPASRSALAAADIALTRAFLQYTEDLTVGRMEPEAVQGSWNVEQDRARPADVLRNALDRGVGETLDEVSAQHIDYKPLREALQRYRLIVDAGGWPTLPDDVTLSHGDAGPAVQALRARLAMTDNLTTPLAGTDTSTALPGDSVATYDIAVVRAVRHFQKRHGLDVTGAVDAETRRALNVSAQERVRQLALNLERHRWLPENLGQNFVFVNIMDFSLTTYRGREKAMEMPVVVGEEDKQTTAFADTMRYVVFGPYWNIPREIAIEEMLPKVQQDSSYLKANNLEVVNAAGDVVDASLLSEEALQRYDVRLREKPGASNSLGLVKFMFPNDHDIYLHDTPANHLFHRPTRTFSHGCVRVERPAEFAAHVLPEGWDEERVREAMTAGERKRISLRQRLPVYLVYLTAWAEPGGPVHFRRDLYGHDDALETALDRPEPRPDACWQIDDLFQKINTTDTSLFAGVL